MDKYLLIKFGEERHVRSLQQEGLIYCKDLKYFADLEDNNNRGDKLEAALSFQYEPEAMIELKPLNKPEKGWVKFKSRDLSITKYSKNPLGNLYCMSALKIPVTQIPTIYKINEQFASTYTHYLLIYDVDAFLERLKIELDKLPFKYYYNLVEYLNFRNYTGEKRVFQKDTAYSWQEEFRIYFDTEKTEPFSFSIGSIEDISTIYALSKTPGFMVKATFQEP